MKGSEEATRLGGQSFLRGRTRGRADRKKERKKEKRRREEDSGGRGGKERLPTERIARKTTKSREREREREIGRQTETRTRIEGNESRRSGREERERNEVNKNHAGVGGARRSNHAHTCAAFQRPQRYI